MLVILKHYLNYGNYFIWSLEFNNIQKSKEKRRTNIAEIGHFFFKFKRCLNISHHDGDYNIDLSLH